MKVLFATTNPAKVKRYASKLQNKGIEVLTLKDISLKLEVEETGKNGKTIYNVFDATHFYYFSDEIFTQLFRANSIPWATSKDPDKMIIDVTGIPLTPGNFGKDCKGNGKHYDE